MFGIDLISKIRRNWGAFIMVNRSGYHGERSGFHGERSVVTVNWSVGTVNRRSHRGSLVT